MQINLCVWMLLGVLAGSVGVPGGTQAPDAAAYLGTWAGTWEGEDRSGGFELTLERRDAGSLAGRVAVTGQPAYETDLRTVSIDGPTMTARYDFPPDDGVEIVLVVTFDGARSAGTWSARVKANGNEAATGTVTMTRK